ncbi:MULTISPECIES: hydroxyphenylacetyl-CoA thioesterase PaaI [unclassified Pseudomonas]|uniref:hydroxyphenylacetyl-CoA thioesterase PaaI n=1 Tax=unclassified Pseudomonas TaxID=196821 RepID=UPI0016179F15|nr:MULTISPECIES: hydroxyphenylacetyl-CoA thioesterase PaaI [unclassified Pseudomonas]MBB6290491.1 acyl-CoA thioesterase [Pseudomonas sp. SJZ073]MBB6315782.1 acyl-CoA thioesterase [Pseudomonas sp. JAI120]
MPTENAQTLAIKCAEAMFERDIATRSLGVDLQWVKPGAACLAMTVKEHMIQGHGTCHGGYLFTLADSAFAFACNSHDRATVAQGCSIDYVSPAGLGDRLVATANEVSRGGRTGNYHVRIETDNGRLVALFHGRSYELRGAVIQQENPHG